MPIYSYSCPQCKSQIKQFHTKGQPECVVCQITMERFLGIPDIIPMETTDAYRGQSRFQDTNAKGKKRVDAHFKKVELPQLIEREGRAYAIKQGWIKPENEPK